jgi:hypothetical protein
MREKPIGAEIRETGSPHFQSQRRTVQSWKQRTPNCAGHIFFCIGKGLGTLEHLFVSVKINYIFGYSDLQI